MTYYQTHTGYAVVLDVERPPFQGEVYFFTKDFKFDGSQGLMSVSSASGMSWKMLDEKLGTSPPEELVKAAEEREKLRNG